MISSAITLTAGFIAGLFYSRGKADPVQAAWFDLKRHTRTIGRETGKLWHFLAGKATSRKRTPGTIDAEDANCH